uniref:NADH-ubiquinone oxidoreductase chain 4L n=1 Tax=Phloeotribus sp. BMNH 1047247 TaxID=1903799 RepID=A0A343A5H9_9CUCU|nr:NADH dehydrogenase subunit 4L [Phloeotribus sp. BMNH 1047247]
MYSILLFFISSIYIFVIKYKHFLMMLMSMEAMVLAIYMYMFIYLSQFYSEYFSSLLFLTFSVCESALGLSLLVLLIRIHGSDSLFMFDNLW